MIAAPSLRPVPPSLLTIPLLLVACSGPADRPPLPGQVRFDETSVGAFVGRLRASQGGLERWRSFGGVRFAYRVEWPGGARSFARVGFRFDDPEHLWIEEARGDATRVVAVASPDCDSEREAEPAAVDFALRSLRFLFAPALVTADGRWKYQELMAPSPLAVPPRIEVLPVERTPPRGAYLLEPGARTGRLARVLYRVAHPYVRGATGEVRFRSYRPVSGLAIAHAREHRRRRRFGEEDSGAAESFPVDPFEPLPPPPPTVVTLSERLDRVEFVPRSALDEAMPLPEDGGDTGERHARGAGSSD